jgi:hypothetical protein
MMLEIFGLLANGVMVRVYERTLISTWGANLPCTGACSRVAEILMAFSRVSMLVLEKNEKYGLLK